MGLRGPKPEKINEDALLSCSPESDYWCGILATEGCICFTKSYAKSTIQYAAADIEHVYKFRDFLGSKRKIQLVERVTEFGPTRYGSFRFSSVDVGEFLIGNGITPRKSLTLKVSDRLAGSVDHWRGAIDGDGSVCFNQDRPYQQALKLGSCSFHYIEQFAQFCLDRGFDPRVTLNLPNVGRMFGYSVTFNGDQCVELVKSLYGHGGTSLDRKQGKADKVMVVPITGCPRHSGYGPRVIRYDSRILQLTDRAVEKDSDVVGEGDSALPSVQ